jgi:hypothetical protein
MTSCQKQRQGVHLMQSDAAGGAQAFAVSCNRHAACRHHIGPSAQGAEHDRHRRSRGLRTQSRLQQHSVVQIKSNRARLKHTPKSRARRARPETELRAHTGLMGWLGGSTHTRAQSNTCTAQVMQAETEPEGAAANRNEGCNRRAVSACKERPLYRV